MAVLTAAVTFMAITGQPGSLGQLLQDNLRADIGFFVSLQFLVLMPGIFLAEYFFPARKDQIGISPTVGFDALYMSLHLPIISAIGAWLSGPLAQWLDANASWLVVDTTRSWPLWLTAILGIAIGDLGVYVAHMIKHKVGFLWRFHMIHHGQARLNAFTSNRTHPLDALFDTFFLLVPLFIFFPSITADAGAVFIVGLGATWITRFQHANIRTNLGPLRYIFVTPQSHRVHHSARPDHWNSNYANIFAFDRLFGTQHADVTSYPPTGIGDDSFPEPQSWSPVEFARAFVGQMLYPFDKTAVGIATDASSYAKYEVDEVEDGRGAAA